MLRVSTRAEVESIVQPGWRVLDVGAGDNPFKHATVLLDALPSAMEHEGRTFRENPTGKVEGKGRKVVVGDIERIPFDDGEFDFVYASHVLEHTTDPSAAIREMERVASRGYIEVPRSWFEFVDGSPFHKWLIDMIDGVLVFRPKTSIERDFGLKRRILDCDKPLFLELYSQSVTGPGNTDPGGTSLEKSVCHICAYWEGSIPFRIEAQSTYIDPSAAEAGLLPTSGPVPVSVIVHTRDEEAQIQECLSTCLGWADEVIVADMSSKDATRFLARVQGARVMEVPIEAEFDRTRNDSAAVARNDWVLFLDADERLTPTVKSTVERCIASAPEDVAAFRIPYKVVSFGSWIRHAGHWWPSYKSPALLRKGRFRFPGPVHLPAIVDGQTVTVEPQSDEDAIAHFSHPNLDKYFGKLNRYTTLEVEKMRQTGQEPSWEAVADGLGGAMRWYFDDTDGKRDGLAGFLLSLGSGIYEAASQMKFLESAGVGSVPPSAEAFFERTQVAAQKPRRSEMPQWMVTLAGWLAPDEQQTSSNADAGFDLGRGRGWIAVSIEKVDELLTNGSGDGLLVFVRDSGLDERNACRERISAALGAAVHLIEQDGSDERWWFGWQDGQRETLRRICSHAHSNSLGVMGGGEVQLFQSLKALRARGVTSDVKVGGDIPQGYDLCHVYSIHHPAPPAPAARSPYVLSPIYWDRSELAWVAPRLSSLFSRTDDVLEIDSGYAALRSQVKLKSVPAVQHLAHEVKALAAGAERVLPNAQCELERFSLSIGAELREAVFVPNACTCCAPGLEVATGLLPDGPFVLCVGRVEPNKNQLTLLWALRDEPIDVVLIGGAPDQDYLELCRSIGGDKVWLLGAQPPGVVFAALERAVAHCLPSFGETPGIANLEAAAVGCPIVVGDRGAEREYFGGSAWYVAPLDPAGIKRAVLEASNSRGSSRVIQLQGRVSLDYSWQRVAEQLATIYEELVGAGAGNG